MPNPIHDHDDTVVDAKYYAGTKHGSPGWGDMVKQFYYGISLEEVTGCKNITNYFLFPGEGGPLESGIVFDPATNKVIESDYFKPIKCLYLSPIKVMEHYNSFRKLPLDLVG